MPQPRKSKLEHGATAGVNVWTELVGQEAVRLPGADLDFRLNAELVPHVNGVASVQHLHGGVAGRLLKVEPPLAPRYRVKVAGRHRLESVPALLSAHLGRVLGVAQSLHHSGDDPGAIGAPVSALEVVSDLVQALCRQFRVALQVQHPGGNVLAGLRPGKVFQTPQRLQQDYVQIHVGATVLPQSKVPARGKMSNYFLLKIRSLN